LKQIRGADGRLGFAPVGGVGRGEAEIREAEVGHGPGHRSYIEGVARGD
jgi:hypothetical protein